MDGQAHRTIQTREDMLRDFFTYFKGNWDKHFTLVEFSYNNYFDLYISLALYEALYGRRFRSPIGWFKVVSVCFFVPI